MSDSPPESSLSSLPIEQLVACHECDLLMRKPVLQDGESAECPRCGYELFSHRHHVVRRSLALVLTALLLYVPANFLPIMQLNLLGQTSQDTVATSCSRPSPSAALKMPTRRSWPCSTRSKS
ncbi:Paraquat-inducible protein A [Pseudomonas oleovorans subsp. oleovorans]|uniref:Paraquat-inducible protein A n=1 Tax=Ectopseudomonas oleovorans TaxID=301 RepID=A0A379JZW4_ECTOL|nr:Paraquat-inducible protein A [Pseudomonas oleovorans subsp. oleovorans]SUD53731.1 paraquat-inducible protein A [Pseudomonas oleovorans]